MFKRFKKKKTEIYCPLNGEVLAIEAVSDPVFASKAMGDGFAVEPTDGRVYSPVAGKVTSIFPTKHAIGLMTEDGLEVLIHIGIDTVALNGEGFDILVNEGTVVAADTLLAKVDLEHLRNEQKPTTTMVIFTNLADQPLKIQTGTNAAQAVIGSL